jgi:hypothetical protein
MADVAGAKPVNRRAEPVEAAQLAEADNRQ